MRVLIIGRDGQVARSLLAHPTSMEVEVVAVGRPELNLAVPATIAPAIARARPDFVVNAAAYTAVDKAQSEPDVAWSVNAAGATAVAEVCAARGIPLVHISTDYVFDGSKSGPYIELDATSPVSAYGRTKLAGEKGVIESCPQHIILRTAWVHSPYGHNFVKTILRLAASRPEISVVDDQRGNPTYAPHLAGLIMRIARQFSRTGALEWGIFNATGAGETTWCGFARELLEVSVRLGGPSCTVKAISTAEYPTPAKRPANSCLDNAKTVRAFGASLPDWRVGVGECVTMLRRER